MKTTIKFSENVIAELEKKVTTGTPLFSSAQGDLFVLSDLPLGAIRLKIPLEDYLAFVITLCERENIPLHFIVPVQNKLFQVVVNTAITKKGETILIGGKQAQII